MIGEHSRLIYRLGNRIKVKVARVDLDERKIDFELSDEQPASVTSEQEQTSADNAIEKAREKNKKGDREKSSDKKAKKRPPRDKKSSSKKKTSKKKTMKKKRGKK